METYTRLILSEREEISISTMQSKSIRSIAKKLNRAPSTISRELQRNRTSNNAYRAVVAQSRANVRAHISRRQRKLVINQKLKRFIVAHLKEYWSPEQIAKKLRFMYPSDMSMHVSHETIYSYLYVKPRGQLKELLIRHLRQNRQRLRIET